MLFYPTKSNQEFGYSSPVSVCRSYSTCLCPTYSIYPAMKTVVLDLGAILFALTPENTKIVAAQCREGKVRINPASFVHFMPQETTVGREVEADRLRKKQDVKSKTATKMANFKTVCSYFRDQLNNVINMLMSTKLSFCRKGYPNRIIYNDFHTRYVILAPKESVATMKKMKRPVTEEKKNIAATHAVMDKINLVGDKFQ